MCMSSSDHPRVNRLPTTTAPQKGNGKRMTDKKVQSLQRVLEYAAKVFATRRFESVSITEIAELARCSTATIYEVYGSKENLFQAAVNYMFDNVAPARITSRRHGDPLANLLAFVEWRARHLADPKERKVRRSLLSQQDRLAQQVCDDRMNALGELNAFINRAAKDCIDAKLLRDLDVEIVAYNIMAGALYEPFVHCLIYGDEAPVNLREIIRKIFTPLVSAKGALLLKRYLESMDNSAQSSHAADASH